MFEDDNNTCNLYGCFRISDHTARRYHTLYYNFHIDFKESDPCVFTRMCELDFSARKQIDYKGQIEGIAIAGGFVAEEIKEDVSSEGFRFLKLNVDSKEEFESVCNQWIKDRQIRLKAEAINRGILLDFLSD